MKGKAKLGITFTVLALVVASLFVAAAPSGVEAAEQEDTSQVDNDRYATCGGIEGCATSCGCGCRGNPESCGCGA